MEKSINMKLSSNISSNISSMQGSTLNSQLPFLDGISSSTTGILLWCLTQMCMGFLSAHKNILVDGIGDKKTPQGVNEHANGALWWTGVPCMVYSRLGSSVPWIFSSLTRTEDGWMDEWMNECQTSMLHQYFYPVNSLQCHHHSWMWSSK